MATASCNMNQVPFCCGMYEAGRFDGADVYGEYAFELDADSTEELFTNILEHAAGRPVLFNFVKCLNYKGVYNKQYQAHDLRKLVKKHPNVISIGEWINPGSKNMIDAYIIKDYKSE